MGADSLGQEYLEKLKQEHIDISHVKIQNDIHSGIAQIIVTETGIIVTIFSINIAHHIFVS